MVSNPEIPVMRILYGVSPLMLVVTFGLGAINGFCISCLRVPAIVMTLGMNIILQGALVALHPGSPGHPRRLFF